MIRTRLDYDYYKAEESGAGYRKGEESRGFNFYVTGAKTEQQLRDTLSGFECFISENGYSAHGFGFGTFEENGYESECLYISVSDVEEKNDFLDLYREWKQMVRRKENEANEETSASSDAQEITTDKAVVRPFMDKWAVCDGVDESGNINPRRMGNVFSWHDTFEDADAERARINSHSQHTEEPEEPNDTERKSRHISQLPQKTRALIYQELLAAGLMADDRERALNSRLCDLEDTIDITPYIQEVDP